MLLYRYLSEEAARLTIERKQLKVSRVRDLNDPFEWLPCISDEFAPDVKIRLENLLPEIFGFISYSETWSEPVLWSHYADRHRGLVLGVETTDDPEINIKVSYDDNRARLDLISIEDNDRFEIFTKRMLKNKSSAWSYEKERRMYESFSECKARDGNYFVDLKPSEFKLLILGWKCRTEAAYFRAILDQGGYKDTEIFTARPSNLELKIDKAPWTAHKY
jgi:hypothetical protein